MSMDKKLIFDISKKWRSFRLDEEKLNEFNLKMPKNRDEAEQQAMDWSSNFANKSHSWEDVIKAGDHFRKVAKKFNLTKDFKENGII